MQALSVFRITRQLRRAGARRPVASLSLIFVVLAGVVVSQRLSAAPPPSTSVDLSTYVRIERWDLPEPTRTAAPAGSLLAQEASGITYNWDTGTLFVVGDGGTSVVQVSKTGVLIDSMSLAPGNSSQGTEFYDTEGISYVGDGKFVLTEERDRKVNLFTYVAGATLQRSDVKTVKLGTTTTNVGIEGVSFDPTTGGYIFVKEKDPQSIFQTLIDFEAGTATNGSPGTPNSTNLFNPTLLNLEDLSDVFALANVNGHEDSGELLVISQESGQILNVSRTGVVSSKLTIVADSGSPLSVPTMTMEGLTMDDDGRLYVVNENGGGDSHHPQLWVYAPSAASNLPPTQLTFVDPADSIPENTNIASPVRLAGIVVTDDGVGTNNLTVSGPDASAFQIIGTALYLRAGTGLNSTTKPTYDITVNVDDPAVGVITPDASTNFTLTITASTGGASSLIISEVAPWASGNGTLGSDWIEITNIGTAAQDMTGWFMDDDSSTANVAPLLGIASIAPGESVIYLESGSSKKAQFLSIWFGANPPANLQVGTYAGSGVGLGTGGDQVNIFEGTIKRAGANFAATTTVSPFRSFDNAAGLTNNAVISTRSETGVNGAFSITDKLTPASAPTSTATFVGSPGTIGAISATPVVSIEATDANAAEAGADPGTFRITRTGSTVGVLTVNYTITGQAASGDYTPALTGAVSIPSGQSFADITVTPVNDGLFEQPETVTLTLFDSGSTDIGDPAAASVTIADDDPPDTMIDSAPADPTSSTSAGFAFGVINADTGSAAFECSLDGPSFSACDGPVNYSSLSDGSHTFTVRAIDANNASNVDPTPASLTWVVDSTNPTILGSRTPAANAAGWNRTAVEVTFSCSDSGGTGVNSCGPSPQTVSTEGAGQSRTGTAIDGVGNSASVTVTGISIDLTAPSIGACPASGPYAFGVAQMLSVVATDSLSGPATATLSLAANTADPGVHALTFVATDTAGNTASKVCNYEVTVMAAMQRVLDQINAAIPGASDRDGRRLSRAAARLADALDAGLWKDGDNLEKRKGLKVVVNTLLSIEALTEIVLDRKSTIADATVKGWINALARSLKALGE